MAISNARLRLFESTLSENLLRIRNVIRILIFLRSVCRDLLSNYMVRARFLSNVNVRRCLVIRSNLRRVLINVRLDFRGLVRLFCRSLFIPSTNESSLVLRRNDIICTSVINNRRNRVVSLTRNLIRVYRRVHRHLVWSGVTVLYFSDICTRLVASMVNT